MPKYQVKHTSIMHNKTVYAEGSTIELSDDQAKRLSDFLEPVSEVKAATNSGTSKVETDPKTKTEVVTKNVKNSKSTAKTKTAKEETKPKSEDESAQQNDSDTQQNKETDTTSTDGGDE